MNKNPVKRTYMAIAVYEPASLVEMAWRLEGGTRVGFSLSLGDLDEGYDDILLLLPRVTKSMGTPAVSAKLAQRRMRLHLYKRQIVAPNPLTCLRFLDTLWSNQTMEQAPWADKLNVEAVGGYADLNENVWDQVDAVRANSGHELLENCHFARIYFGKHITMAATDSHA